MQIFKNAGSWFFSIISESKIKSENFSSITYLYVNESTINLLIFDAPVILALQ